MHVGGIESELHSIEGPAASVLGSRKGPMTLTMSPVATFFRKFLKISLG